MWHATCHRGVVTSKDISDALRRASEDVDNARKALEESRNKLARARHKLGKHNPRDPRPDAQRNPSDALRTNIGTRLCGVRG
jgi:hypothetical protein